MNALATDARTWAVLGVLVVVGITAAEVAQYWLGQGWVFWAWLSLVPIGLLIMATGLNRMRQGLGTRAVAASIAFVIFLTIAVPFLLVVVFGSFLNQRDLISNTPYIFPPNPTTEWYERLWDRPRFTEAVRTSFYIATSTTLFVTLFGILGAYAIARLRFPARTAVYNAIMLAYMLPGIALLVPLVFVFRRLDLVDTLPGMLLGHSALLLPLVIWLLMGAFEGVEPDLEHAARVDGANRWRTVWTIVVPVTIPSVATVAVFGFVLSWNELLFSRVLATSQIQLLSPEILKLMDPIVRVEPTVSAAGVISSIPVIILALLMQRFIIREIGEGAVK
jgi:multiple sugar transport system permease protein